MSFQHPFLDAKQTQDLKKFAEIMHINGQMTAMTVNELIARDMLENGCPPPHVQAGDHHCAVLFSNKEWSWLVVAYKGFENKKGNGLAALKVKRKYLFEQFKNAAGVFDPERAKRIVDGMFALMLVNPRDVEFDWGGFDGKEQQ